MNEQSWFVSSPGKQRVLLFTIFLLTVLEFLQSGMIAFSASPIMGETGTSPEEYGFITAAYACVAIIMISKQRWIVERTGWRRYIWCSITVFITGAAICAESDSYHELLTGRVIMGIGGASFMTGARVLVNLIPPSPKRFVGIKVFATGLAVGMALAPLLASLSVSEFTWSGIFYILIIIACIAFVTSAFCLPDSAPEVKVKSDTHPFLLMFLAGGAFSLLWALQRSNYNFYSDSLILIIIAVTAITAIIYFLRGLSRHTGTPLLMVRELFNNKRYIAGVLIFSMCYLILGMNNYLIPQFLETAMGYSWSTAGIWHAVGLSSAVVAWLIMGKVMPKKPGSKKFFIIGFLSLSVYGLMMTRLTPTANIISDILPALLFNGVFMMLVMATAAVQTFREVQHNETVFSHAQQVKNMASQFFMAIGITTATVGLQWRTTVHYAILNTRVSEADPRYQTALNTVASLYERHTSSARADSMAISWISQVVKQQATLLGVMDFYWCIFIVGVVSAVIMACQKMMK